MLFPSLCHTLMSIKILPNSTWSKHFLETTFGNTCNHAVKASLSDVEGRMFSTDTFIVLRKLYRFFVNFGKLYIQWHEISAFANSRYIVQTINKYNSKQVYVSLLVSIRTTKVEIKQKFPLWQRTSLICNSLQNWIKTTTIQWTGHFSCFNEIFELSIFYDKMKER